MEARLVERLPVHHLLVLAALALDTAGHDDPSKRPRAYRYGPLIHLTTLNRDGSPQVSVVWMGIEEDEFVSGHMRLHQKVKNVQRDPRVVFSCLGRGTNPLGLRTYLVVHGKARVTEGGAPALLQRLAPLYLGLRACGLMTSDARVPVLPRLP
jgi:PPOX class probable F420-dependent enzyme